MTANTPTAANPAAAPPPNTDSYLWVGPSTGRWGDSANWEDQTTNTTGSVPTAQNPVMFGVDTTAQQTLANVTVLGLGRSASLGLYGNLTLEGRFSTGALNLNLFYNPSSPYSTSASLTVTGADHILHATSAHAAGDLTVNDGAAVIINQGYEIASGRPFGNAPDYQLDGITVDGAGSKLTIGGVLSTDNASDILVTNGGYLEVRNVTLDNTYGVAGYQVDAQSTIEVGTLGNAAAGTWTIDGGRILTIEKDVRLSAPEFVVNGWIIDVGGLDLTGSPGNVTGTGRIKIEAGALLSIGHSGNQLSVVFRGNNAELSLADGSGAFRSTILGFAAGDSISVTGPTFDSATWKGGVLDLFEGATLVGNLRMAGQYTGDTFSVSNNVITLASTSSSAVVERGGTAAAPRPLQLFMHELASFERQGSALHELSAAVAQHVDHVLLAAAAR